MMIPPNFSRVGSLHLPIDRATGLDALVLALLPAKWAVRYAARRIAKNYNLPGKPGVFTFSIPSSAQVWEILDKEGREIRPFVPQEAK